MTGGRAAGGGAGVTPGPGGCTEHGDALSRGVSRGEQLTSITGVGARTGVSEQVGAGTRGALCDTRGRQHGGAARGSHRHSGPAPGTWWRHGVLSCSLGCGEKLGREGRKGIVGTGVTAGDIGGQKELHLAGQGDGRWAMRVPEALPSPRPRPGQPCCWHWGQACAHPGVTLHRFTGDLVAEQ